MSQLRLPARHSGFTMIEVLVAVLVLAVGLLGLAGLQTMGLRATTGSYTRTQALTVAQELAERMRLNKIDPNTTAAYPYDELVDSACNNLALPATPTAAQIAQTDLDQVACLAAANFNLSTADDAATTGIDERGINVHCPPPPNQANACTPQELRVITVNWVEVGMTGNLENKNVQVQLIP